jgi:probable phosphoglycerate mutase
VAEGTRIILVRHGESRAQELGFLGGHDGCKGLSDTGRQQVEQLRDRLASTGELADASALYSSVMPRAVETAEIIAPALGGLDVEQECDFCEGHPGEADGLTWAELDERYPVDGGWNGNVRRAPGWETWSELGDRVARALGMLVERHAGSTVVVACHGGVVVHAVYHYLGLDLGGGNRAWIAPDNTSLTEFRFAPNPWSKSTLPVHLVRYNDHAHLGALDRAAHSI